MHVKQFHHTGTDRNFVTVYRLPRYVDPTGEKEFQLQAVEVGEHAAMPRFSRAEMHDLHKALGEMLGLGVPSTTAPMTASKPAKNPRRVNGGL